jgi:hypothetical protein
MSYRSSATSSYTTVRGGAPYRKPASASSSPVCVHCRNLGLEFDHWLRKSPEPDSPVVCKVLLATECRYCHAFGHTVGSCPAKKRSTMRNACSLAPAALAPTVLPARSKNVYSVFDDDTSGSDSESKNNSVGVGVGISCKRVDVKSLFASKKPIVEEVPSYAANTKRVDVGTLFSAIPVSKLDTPAYDNDNELHEHDYDWTTYGDPEVDCWIAKIRDLFARKSWAEICYDTDSDDDDE